MEKSMPLWLRVEQMVAEAIRLKTRFLAEQGSTLLEAARVLADTLRQGGKVLIFGNGGSAADAQHFAAELIGRFERERGAISAIALATDTAVLTALANDYGYETIFSRQVEGLALPGVVLITISASGNSKNLILAVKSAREMGVKSIGLLGRGGGDLASIVDMPVVVPHLSLDIEPVQKDG